MQKSLRTGEEAAMIRLVKDPCSCVPPSCSNCFTEQKNLTGEKTMKTLKAICTAAILALALSVPAYAGDILTPGFTAPPPPPPPESNITGDVSVPTATSSAPGDMST